MPCFKHIILTRDFKGAKVEAGRPKRSCYLPEEVLARDDGGLDCSGGGRGVEQEIWIYF